MKGSLWFVPLTALCLVLPVSLKATDDVRFSTIEQVRTKTDVRQRMIDFEISSSRRSVSYEVRETPKGSLEPKVKAIDSRRDVELKEADVNSLLNRLVAAGLFKLPLSTEHRGEGSIWTLFGSLNGHKFELSYRRPPRSGVRKKVDDAVTAIVRELGLDQIRGSAITESEGDLVPPRQTTFDRLISHADEFHGKRVSIVGFYHSEFEGCELRAEEKSDFGKNVWCDEISAFAPRGVGFCQDCWARVEGTFFKGPAGHLGLWAGELTRVTRFAVQTTPSIADARFSRNADRSLLTPCLIALIP